MGAEFTNLTWEDMCDLMCGVPEDDILEREKDENDEREESRINQK